MKQKQAVKPARLADYENAQVKALAFECVDGAVKSVVIETTIGPLSLVLESYSIQVYEPKVIEKFRATVVDSRGHLPDIVKDFEDEYDRKTFVLEVEQDERFTVAISEFREAA